MLSGFSREASRVHCRRPSLGHRLWGQPPLSGTTYVGRQPASNAAILLPPPLPCC